MKIAIVDDDSLFVEIQQHLLIGLEIDYFDSFETFLRYIERQDRIDFDILIVDRFFEAEGLDTLKEKTGLYLRSLKKLNGVTLTIWSQLSIDNKQQQESGFDATLKKDSVSVEAIQALRQHHAH